MTLDELNLIYTVLDCFRNSESCAEMLLTDETDDALLLIEREIKLKTLDPVKGTHDVKGNYIGSE